MICITLVGGALVLETTNANFLTVCCATLDFERTKSQTISLLSRTSTQTYPQDECFSSIQ